MRARGKMVLAHRRSDEPKGTDDLQTSYSNNVRWRRDFQLRTHTHTLNNSSIKRASEFQRFFQAAVFVVVVVVVFGVTVALVVQLAQTCTPT